MATTPYVNIYKDNPTAGGLDGVAVSISDTFTSPINFTLDAEQNESQITKCAIRTQPGYTAQNVTITDHNDNANRITLCKTQDGTFTNSITFDEVNITNSIFYVKATSADTEQAQIDRKIKLRFTGKLLVV
ncbi:MAG: hypothetical protein IKN16_03005 [Selenomonadaceae bacterium]|nr:hypothetical protein [Selenomonadaceae bacterium]